MAGTGFELPPENTGITRASVPSGAESGALGAERALAEAPSDPDLARLIEAWPALPEAIKAGILAMVAAAAGERGS